MSIQILIINGSPRATNNTSYLVQRAIQGVRSINGVEEQTFNFAKKNFNGCNGVCYSYCMKQGKCCLNDDFNSFLQAFLTAEGIIWAIPTYHAGPPAQVKAALDRLGNVIFSFTHGNIPRFNKACGIITHGSSRWGGQELTVQFFLNSFAQLKCIAVAGDSPKSNMAVIGYAPTWEAGSILEDDIALDCAENLGKRVAEMAKIISSGIAQNINELDERYNTDSFIKNIMKSSMASDNEGHLKEGK